MSNQEFTFVPPLLDDNMIAIIGSITDAARLTVAQRKGVEADTLPTMIVDLNLAVPASNPPGHVYYEGRLATPDAIAHGQNSVQTLILQPATLVDAAELFVSQLSPMQTDDSPGASIGVVWHVATVSAVGAYCQLAELPVSPAEKGMLVQATGAFVRATGVI